MNSASVVVGHDHKVVDSTRTRKGKTPNVISLHSRIHYKPETNNMMEKH